MIPFSPPRIDQKIIDEVVDTLKSGWITTGPKTKRFERDLAKYCSVDNVICTNSATSGLEMMLHWFGIGPGDEVITSAYTYSASVNVIEHVGATPVLVDIGDDFNLDAAQIEAKITIKTKVIIPVDIAGYPCDYDRIDEIVKKKGSLFKPRNEIQKRLGRIFILEDAAHSLGASYKDKKIGSISDATVFSFHAVKNLTTAEGGAVCLNFPANFDNAKIYKDLCILQLHGQTKDALSKSQIGNWRYDIITAGFKWNMTDVQASMGLVELERYDTDTLVKRRQIFESYTNLFSNFPQVKTPEFISMSKQSSFHVYLLSVPAANEEQRDRIIRKIFEKGVSVNVHFIPIPQLTYYRNQGYKIEDYPQTYKKFKSEITLPVYYDLTFEQVNTIVKAVKDSIIEILC